MNVDIDMHTAHFSLTKLFIAVFTNSFHYRNLLHFAVFKLKTTEIMQFLDVAFLF